jgi:hypothetical protein
MRPIPACLVALMIVFAWGSAARGDDAEDARLKQRLYGFRTNVCRRTAVQARVRPEI